MNIDEDHIHLLIEIPPTYSVGQTINRLKEMTTNYLYRTQNNWLRNFYWGKNVIYGPHGYFCSTVGHVSQNVVFQYIENQGKTNINCSQQ